MKVTITVEEWNPITDKTVTRSQAFDLAEFRAYTGDQVKDAALKMAADVEQALDVSDHLHNQP